MQVAKFIIPCRISAHRVEDLIGTSHEPDGSIKYSSAGDGVVDTVAVLVEKGYAGDSAFARLAGR